MATPISAHVKDKNSIFTTCDKDIIFYQSEKPWYFKRCLCNKNQLTIVQLKITIGQWIPDQLAIYNHEEGDKIESTKKKTLA